MIPFLIRTNHQCWLFRFASMYQVAIISFTKQLVQYNGCCVDTTATWNVCTAYTGFCNMLLWLHPLQTVQCPNSHPVLGLSMTKRLFLCEEHQELQQCLSPCLSEKKHQIILRRANNGWSFVTQEFHQWVCLKYHHKTDKVWQVC